MKNETKVFLLNWLDREYDKFGTILENLKTNKEEDDIDRLMRSEEHWQSMMDYTRAIKNMIGKLK